MTSYFYTHPLETTLSLTSSNFRFIFRYFPCAISRKGFSTKTCIITSANKYSTEKLKDMEADIHSFIPLFEILSTIY